MSTNKSGILLKAVLFVAMAAIGYFVSGILMKGNQSQTKTTPTETAVVDMSSVKTQAQTQTQTQTQAQPATPTTTQKDQTTPAQTAPTGEPTTAPAQTTPSVATTTAEITAEATVAPTPVEPIKLETSYDPIVSKNYIYSFQAHCNLDGKQNLVYELLDANNDNIIMTSTTGEFTGIKPSATGKYRFRVRVEADGRTSDITTISGFKRAPLIAKKLTEADIEKMIKNSQTTTRENVRYFAKNLKIEYANKIEERSYSYLADIEAQVSMGIWTSVKVVEIKYNIENQVSALKFEIVYP